MRALAVVVCAIGIAAGIFGAIFLGLATSSDPDGGPVDPIYPVGFLSLAACLLGVAVALAARSAEPSVSSSVLWTLLGGTVFGIATFYVVVMVTSS